MPIDARLARVLGTLVLSDAAPVSAIGFDAQLTAMAEASKAVLAADLTCYGAWCADNGCPPFPADPEALVRYLRHLDTRGSRPATLARRLASLATAHRLMGLTDHAELPATDIAEAVRGLSTHSLRVGLTQDLFAAGEDGVGIAQALRWTSPATALRYGRKLAVRSNVAARVLSRVRG